MPIWPFSRKNGPRLQDRALAELAQMFLSNPKEPTPGSELLDLTRFDFTVSSLVALDEHLEIMRNHELKRDAMIRFVLRSGAYAGEVIRRHSRSERAWHWIDYKSATELNQEIVALGLTLGTTAILWNGATKFCFPVAKVGKYLENGSEDSLNMFAEVMIADPPMEGIFW